MVVGAIFRTKRVPGGACRGVGEIMWEDNDVGGLRALLHRVRTLGAGHMPPIGSLRVDEDAVALIEAWIESL